MFLLSKDEYLVGALNRLRQAGLDLDRAWRQSSGETPGFEPAWTGYKEALDEFSVVARAAVSPSVQLRRRAIR